MGIGVFPDKNDIANSTKINDKYLDKNNEEKISKAVDIIKDLNSSQQKEILENLKAKAAEEKNVEKIKTIVKKLKNFQKMNKVINAISKSKIDDFKKSQEKTNELEEQPKIEKVEEKEIEKNLPLKKKNLLIWLIMLWAIYMMKINLLQ